MKIIATIKNDFVSKFGIPRQSGLIDAESKIIFKPEYRNAEALRGLEGYSHIWIIWEFSESKIDKWKPTVRPPKLGGNKRVGVFATRSPFRPNPIGLSCVKIKSIDLNTEKGPVITVLGAAIMNDTPIYDIKPYVPYSDSHPEAIGGFSDQHLNEKLKVSFSDTAINKIPEDKKQLIIKLLEQNPKPAYQKDPNRIYSFEYANIRLKFTVWCNTLTILDCFLIKSP